MSDAVAPASDGDPVSVILLKMGGLLSMTGSSLIMRDLWIRTREKKKISLTATLVFELSICDFCSSLSGPILGTWMVPKETGAYLAAGNTASCTAQGFLNLTFYSSAVLCDTSLAIAYCLIVKKGWKDDHSSNICSWLLRGLPLISLFLSVGPLFDKAYNFGGIAMCDIEPYPFGCSLEDSDVECIRGHRTVTFKLFALSALLVFNLVIIASVLMLIHTVWAMEKKMDRYSAEGRGNRTNTLKTTWQGIWYIAAFGLSWWPFAIFYLVKTLTIYPPPFLEYIFAVTFPAQGAYNAIVYFRPKYKSDRERHRSDTNFTSFCRVLRVSGCNFVLGTIIKNHVRDAFSFNTSRGNSEAVTRQEENNASKADLMEKIESGVVVQV